MPLFAQMRLLKKEYMKSVSIGFFRDDGDFQLLATLNNNDGYLFDNEFIDLYNYVAIRLANKVEQTNVLIFEREDAPDYVTI